MVLAFSIVGILSGPDRFRTGGVLSRNIRPFVGSKNMAIPAVTEIRFHAHCSA